MLFRVIRKVHVFALASAMFLTVGANSFAAQSRCSAPPFGATVSEFKTFIANFGQYLPAFKVSATQFLGAVCSAKFGTTSQRGILYDIGLLDAEIDTKSTTELATDFLVFALKTAASSLTNNK